MFKIIKKVPRRNYHLRKISNSFNGLLTVSNSVSQAISEQKAVVSLESTVITHGMPWPTNFETAMELENIIKEEEAIPVTVGIMNGQIIAGLSNSEIEELARSKDSSNKPIKVSRHNIYNCRNIKYGGTTSSAAMIVANALGINVFATGGIGGVHKDVESTMDISTDLRELGRTPICVVSSGIKSFLDIPKTLEFLETEGVFVCTVKSKVFPGFFTPSSGVKSPNNFESITQVAQVIQDMVNFKLGSGMLVAIPIPNFLEKEGYIIQQAINKSLENVKSANITGSYVTPFVLNQINMLTNGKSLMLNVELIKNNVRVAAKLAKTLQQLKNTSLNKVDCKPNNLSKQKSTIAVIGGCMVDRNSIIKDASVINLETLRPGATYDCITKLTCGGVGRNLADVFHRLNEKCYFISVLGRDIYSDYLIRNSKFLDFSRVKILDNVETGNCSIIACQNNEILFQYGNLSNFQNITPQYLESHLNELKSGVNLVCLDCNLSLETMEYIIIFAKNHGMKIFVEPTDVLLSHKPMKVVAKLKHLDFPIDIISPNILELFNIIQHVDGNKPEYAYDLSRNNDLEIFNYVKSIVKNTSLLDMIPTWIIKISPHGVVFASKEKIFFIKQSKDFVSAKEIIKTSGAGDCLASCALYLKYKLDLSWKDSIIGSMRLVRESLTDSNTVPTLIDNENYSQTNIKEWIEDKINAKQLIYCE